MQLKTELVYLSVFLFKAFQLLPFIETGICDTANKDCDKDIAE